MEKNEINLEMPVLTEHAVPLEDTERHEQPRSAYSVFTRAQKRCILFLISFAASFSTLSSFIFFPAITPLAHSLRTTVGKINLSVTSYMIVSAIIPSIAGNIADFSGRRPSFLFALLVYIMANIGLAVQTSFPALLLLRMLQSAGISGTSIDIILMVSTLALNLAEEML